VAEGRGPADSVLTRTEAPSEIAFGKDRLGLMPGFPADYYSVMATTRTSSSCGELACRWSIASAAHSPIAVVETNPQIATTPRPQSNPSRQPRRGRDLKRVVAYSSTPSPNSVQPSNRVSPRLAITRVWRPCWHARTRSVQRMPKHSARERPRLSSAVLPSRLRAPSRS